MDSQIGNVLLILWVDVFSIPISQEVGSVEIAQESCAIHHTDTAVQSCNLAQTPRGNQLGELLSCFWRRGLVLWEGLLDLIDGSPGEGVGEFGGECFCDLKWGIISADMTAGRNEGSLLT